MAATSRAGNGGRGRGETASRPARLPSADGSSGRIVQLEARCRWLEERLRQLLDTAATAMVAIDASGVVIDWNQAAEDLFGWPREEMAGQLLFDRILGAPLPADAVACLASLRPAEGGVTGERLRLAGRRRDGATFPLGLDVWATRLGDSHTLNAVAYEIDDEGAGEPARCSMGSLVDSTGEAIIGTDLETRICTWNPAAEHTFGYAAGEVAEAPLAMLFPDDRYHELATALDELRRGATSEYRETAAVRKDGASVDVGLTVSLLRDGAGAMNGFSLVARDVTSERRLRAELTDTLQGLEAALGQARQAEAVERGLLADVAHQLRSPLAGIRASADTLLRGVSPSTQEQLLAGMVRETSRAARLLTALLKLARLDEGHCVRPAPCDLLALCRDEAGRAAALAPELTVDVRAVGSPPGKPQLDASAVREILSNLLDNARRHAATRIEVAVSVESLVEVRVADDGPGLPDEMVEEAFARFISLDGQGGSGLGLPIARGLAQAHGGDLSYESRAFVLRLPTTTPPPAHPSGSGPPAG